MNLKRTMVVLVVALALSTAGCQWPMYGYGPAHTGHNTNESKIGVDNVGTLTEHWRYAAPTVGPSSWMLSTPAVAKGVVYVGSGNNEFYAFDANDSGCSGEPVSCEPLWTASTGAYVFSSPAVVGDVVYVGSDDGNLYAFDAAGVENCSGTPKTCDPLWTADVEMTESSPTVVDGRVYINSYSSNGELFVFDAAGTENCAGTPKVCEPLWTAEAYGFSSPAVADGVVYVGSGAGELRAFDAAGVTNCAGSPKVCEPLWAAPVGSNEVWSSPSVVQGVVYLTSYDGQLHAFDAAGVNGCAGDPVICDPLWVGPEGTALDNSAAGAPSVANGTVYAVSYEGLHAFDAAGVQNCSGSPKTCEPLWTAGSSGFPFGSVAIANGVAYAGQVDGKLAAFDAAGQLSCSGTPTVCTPLWDVTLPGGSGSAPTIVNGVVYAGSFDNTLVAYGL